MPYLIRFYFTLIIIFTSTLLYGQDDIPNNIWKDSRQLMKNREYQSTIDTLKAALLILKKEEYQDKNKQELAARMHRNIGACHRRLFEYEKAEINLDAAIHKYQYILSTVHATKRDTLRFGVCFQQKALLMRRWGEFEKAIFYANEAQKIFIEIESAHNQVRVGNIMAGIYFDLQNFKKTESITLQSIKIYHEEKVDRPNLLSDLHTILAAAQMEQEKYTEAEKNYNIALDVTTQTLDSAGIYNNLGILHTRTKEYKTAASNLNKSLDIKKRVHNNSEYHFSYVSTLENFGDLKVAQNDFNTALDYYQLALINLTDNFRDDEDINTNPSTTENHYIYNKPDLLRVLDLKAQAALKNDNIDLAHNTYQVLDEWTNEFYKDLSTNESKLTWIARVHDIYTNAIEVALKKDDKAKAFQYAEKARAVLLWQSHSKQAALNLLSNEDKEKQEDILAQIRQADQQYRDGDIDIAELRSIVNEQNNLEKQFEEKYPEYAKRKYQPKTITVADVQNNILNDSTALIEYHWSDGKLYIFTLTQNDIFINTSNIDTDFHQHIDRFNTTLKSSSSDLTDLTTSGYSIYQKILAPALNVLNDNIKKLTLLPDGKLNHIPFEALATQEVNQLFNIPYLIDDYTLNYLYSCNTYGKIATKEQAQTFLGIAPSYEKTEGLNDLDNEAEVTAISKMYNGKVLLNTQATREAITQDTSNIIHIASHATQGEGEGKIYLYGDDVLTQKDIQTLSWNHVEQVILSACETGTGELKKGEGVLSLGWSFVYRGVPSVVMSQWKVDDASTKQLMLNYHKKLQEKIPADEALRQAKLDFRNNGKDAKKHPYYWAAFIHTGNPPSQQINTFGTKTWYLIPAFLLIAILTFLYRRNSQS